MILNDISWNHLNQTESSDIKWYQKVSDDFKYLGIVQLPTQTQKHMF